MKEISRSVHKLVVLPLLLMAAGQGLAVAQEPPDRPKIGLALAGGGAKGAAHVGVLKVLEELQIPVDYIAGTSMGAVIGGLYASGMSADELEEALLAVDWHRVMNDKPPRRDLSFRRKEDDSRYLLPIEAGLKRIVRRTPCGCLSIVRCDTCRLLGS